MNLITEILRFGQRRFQWSDSERSRLTGPGIKSWMKPESLDAFADDTYLDTWIDMSDEAPRHYLHRFIPKLSIVMLGKSIRFGTDLQKVHNRINLQYALFRVLKTFGAIRLYGVLGEKMMPMIKKYAVIELGVHISHVLQERYGGYEYDFQKYTKYRSLCEDFKQEQNILHQLDHYHILSGRRLGRRLSVATKLAWYDELDKNVLDYESKFNHPRIIWLNGLLAIRRSEVEKNWSSMIAGCDEYLDKIKELPYHHRASVQSFKTHKARALLRNRDYVLAEKVINQAEKESPQASRNWLINRQLLFVCYMRQLKLEAADSLHKFLLTTPQLKLYGSELRDRLYLYEMYLKLFNSDPDKLKIRKIVRELPQMQADRSGMNLSLIIAELVHAVFSKNRKYLVTRSNEITTYINKYCKENVRSKCFVRLLLHLARADTTWNRWTSYHNRMYAMMQHAIDVTEDIEIIDYEILWKHVADRYLEDNARYKFYKTESAPYTLAGL